MIFTALLITRIYHYYYFRKQCFTTEFFKGCLDALQLSDEVNAIKSYIKLVNGADPNI